MGIASLVLGIISLLLSFTFFKFISFVCGVIGFVFGLIIIFGKKGKGFGIAGVILVVIAMMILFSDVDTSESENDKKVKNDSTGTVTVSEEAEKDKGENNETENSETNKDEGQKGETKKDKTENNETGKNTNAGKSKESEKEEEVILGVGDTWTVDGQWNFTIDSVTTTSERNQFSDDDPAQVVIITYSYENLGYEDSLGLTNGVLFWLDTETVIDGTGEVASSYPLEVSYPKEAPVGAKCSGAQSCIGLKNVSDEITVIINQYDSNYKSQSVKYKLKVD